MEITISARENSSILQPISFELEKYTIFAGENNAGKSSLLRAINDHPNFAGYRKILIPADHVHPEDSETKVSAATDAFYRLLDSILGPIFNADDMLDDLIERFDSSPAKTEFVAAINSKLEYLGVDKKEFDVEIPKEKFKNSLIIKIIEAFTRDLYRTPVSKVDFKNIGMGTQRLIVAALVQYYAENKTPGDNVLFIFEEPELYLHPKWKESLHNALVSLSENEGTFVVIATHDPYFIELGKGQKIYQVFRDEDNDDVTAVKPMDADVILPYRSDAEINYLVFSVASKAYFLELYEFIKNIKHENSPYWEFDKHMFDEYFNNIGIKRDSKDDYGYDCLSVTRLRHNLAHPGGGDVDPTVLSDAIEKLREFYDAGKEGAAPVEIGTATIIS